MISTRTLSIVMALWLASYLSAGIADAVDPQTMGEYQAELERLDKVNFHPNLLPLILRHKDYLELTQAQIDAFRGWREANAEDMFAAMNEIIRKRIEFKAAALSPNVSAEDLRRKQQEIFALHQKVLDYKLSCRENIVKTFNAQNWEDFYVILAEEGYAIPEPEAAEMLGMSEVSD